MVVADIILFVIGMAALLKGSDWLVNHATKIARSFGISEFIIGFTLVAFATSLPEFVVSLISAYSGAPDIVTGTIIGSNIFNIGIILGLILLVTPVAVDKTFKKDVYLLLIASILAVFLLLNGLYFLEGIILISILVYQANLYKIKHYSGFKRILENFFHRRSETTDIPHNTKTKTLDILIIIGSAILLAIGGMLTIASTINIATFLRIPEYFIAIIAIAIGTSLPEITTSIVAAYRGITGVSVGNIIGSNIFNLSILGMASLIAVIPAPPTLFLSDLPVMLLLTLLLVFFMHIKRELSRLEGVIFIILFLIFFYFQIATL